MSLYQHFKIKASSDVALSEFHDYLGSRNSKMKRLPALNASINRNSYSRDGVMPGADFPARPMSHGVSPRLLNEAKAISYLAVMVNPSLERHSVSFSQPQTEPNFDEAISSLGDLTSAVMERESKVRSKQLSAIDHYRTAAAEIDKAIELLGDNISFHQWWQCVMRTADEAIERADRPVSEKASNGSFPEAEAGTLPSTPFQNADVERRPNPLRSAVLLVILHRLFQMQQFPDSMWHDLLSLIYEGHSLPSDGTMGRPVQRCLARTLQRGLPGRFHRSGNGEHDDLDSKVSAHLSRFRTIETLVQVRASNDDLIALTHKTKRQLVDLHKYARDNRDLAQQSRLKMCFSAWRSLKYLNAWKKVCFKIRMERRGTAWVRRCFDAWKAFVVIEQTNQEAEEAKLQAQDIVRSCEDVIEERQMALRHQLLRERQEYESQIEALKGEKKGQASGEVVAELERLRALVSELSNENKMGLARISELEAHLQKKQQTISLLETTSRRSLQALRRSALFIIGPRQMNGIKATDVVLNARGIGSIDKFYFTSEDGVDSLSWESFKSMANFVANGNAICGDSLYSSKPSDSSGDLLSAYGSFAIVPAPKSKATRKSDLVFKAGTTNASYIHLTSLVFSWVNGVLQKDAEQEILEERVASLAARISEKMSESADDSLTLKSSLPILIPAGRHRNIFPGIASISAFASGQHYYRLLRVILGKDCPLVRQLEEVNAVMDSRQKARHDDGTNGMEASATRRSLSEVHSELKDVMSHREAMFYLILSRLDETIETWGAHLMESRRDDAVRLLLRSRAAPHSLLRSDPRLADLLAQHAVFGEMLRPEAVKGFAAKSPSDYSVASAPGAYSVLHDAFSGGGLRCDMGVDVDDFSSDLQHYTSSGEDKGLLSCLRTKIADSPFTVSDYVSSSSPRHLAAHYYLLVLLMRLYASLKIIRLPQWNLTLQSENKERDASLADEEKASPAVAVIGLEEDAPLHLNKKEKNHSEEVEKLYPLYVSGSCLGSMTDPKIPTLVDHLALTITLAQASIASWTALLNFVQEAFYISFKHIFVLSREILLENVNNIQLKAHRKTRRSSPDQLSPRQAPPSPPREGLRKIRSRASLMLSSDSDEVESLLSNEEIDAATEHRPSRPAPPLLPVTSFTSRDPAHLPMSELVLANSLQEWSEEQHSREAFEMSALEARMNPSSRRFIFNPVLIAHFVSVAESHQGLSLSAADAFNGALSTGKGLDVVTAATIAAAASDAVTPEQAAVQTLCDTLFSRVIINHKVNPAVAAQIERFVLYDLPLSALYLDQIFSAFTSSSFASKAAKLLSTRDQSLRKAEQAGNEYMTHAQWIFFVRTVKHFDLGKVPEATDANTFFINASGKMGTTGAIISQVEMLSKKYAIFAPREGLYPLEFSMALMDIALQFFASHPAMLPRERGVPDSEKRILSSYAERRFNTTVPRLNELLLYTLLTCNVLPRLPLPLIDARLQLRNLSMDAVTGLLALSSSGNIVTSDSISSELGVIIESRLPPMSSEGALPTPFTPLHRALGLTASLPGDYSRTRKVFLTLLVPLYEQCKWEVAKLIRERLKGSLIGSQLTSGDDINVCTFLDEALEPFARWAANAYKENKMARSTNHSALKEALTGVEGGGLPSDIRGAFLQASGTDWLVILKEKPEPDGSTERTASSTGKKKSRGNALGGKNPSAVDIALTSAFKEEFNLYSVTHAFFKALPRSKYRGVSTAIACFLGFIYKEFSYKGSLSNAATFCHRPDVMAICGIEGFKGIILNIVNSALSDVYAVNKAESLSSETSPRPKKKIKHSPRTKSTPRSGIEVPFVLSASPQSDIIVPPKVDQSLVEQHLQWLRHEATQFDAFADIMCLLALNIFPSPTYTVSAKLHLFMQHFFVFN